MDRTPKNYDGILPTNKSLQKLIPDIMQELGKKVKEGGDLVIAAWQDVVGESIAPMTKAVSFEKGTLTVQVKNATLHSVLSGEEKRRLLKLLQEKCPFTKIQNIIFRRI